MAKRKELQDEANATPPAAANAAPAAADPIAAPAETASETPAATGGTPPIEAMKIEPPAMDTAPAVLPLIDSPALDGSGRAAEASADNAARPESVAPAPTVQAEGSSRFALLAASIAIAATVGSFVGSLGAAGVARLLPGPAAPVVANSNNHGSAQLAAEMATLKANLDTSARSANAQLGKIADRIERAQADPAAKLARLADAVERLEKRSVAAAAAAPETTGSIGAPSAAAAEPKPADRVLDGWVVHQVVNGHALVESRYGNMFDIAAGGFLPGVGKVEQIKRQDGHWLVVTARGVIQSYH